ncbi:MAG: hypothetical protein MUE73_18600 [Planctomycetes bacterium]|jgi:hypothetical protein|nr:hypothetical protein [Planctomycetota bacterium]
MKPLMVGLSLALVVLTPGCLLLAGAAAGAGAVLVSGEDTAYVDLKTDRDTAYRKATAVVEVAGRVTSSSPDLGTLAGEVEKSDVEVDVFLVGDAARVSVKARKLGKTVPDLELAQRLAAEIGR